MRTRHLPSPCGFFPFLLAFSSALALLCGCDTPPLAQNAPWSTTNAMPPLAATNGITLSSYPHPMAWVRPIVRATDPTNSTDKHFDWWPRRGTNQVAEGKEDTVDYTFAKPARISQAKVYWFDDSGRRGGCAIPVAWSLFYKDGQTWKPVKASEPYVVTKNAYDEMSFKPVTTSALRLSVKFQPGWSAGVESLKVR